MSLAVLRFLDESENEKVIEYETLMHNLTNAGLQQENPNDYCERDGKFLQKLQMLAQVDEGVISRVKYIREKLAKSLPVLPHEWQEMILVLNCKGFYSCGVNIGYVTFIGDVDLEGAVIGGDFNAAHSTITGNCNERGMLVLGGVIEDGREVKGEHLIGGQRHIEEDLAIRSIKPQSPPLQITYEDKPVIEEEESIEVDLSSMKPSAPPAQSVAIAPPAQSVAIAPPAQTALPDDEILAPKFPTDPPVTLRSQTPQQLEKWRREQLKVSGQRKHFRKKRTDIKTVKIPKSPRVPNIPAEEFITEDAIHSIRPPAKKKINSTVAKSCCREGRRQLIISTAKAITTSIVTSSASAPRFTGLYGYHSPPTEIIS